MSAVKLPGSLQGNPRLSQWLRFGADGVVEVRTGKVEIGQGILTALRQIAADELDVALARVRIVPAQTRGSPNEGMTSGSYSIEHSGGALRQACAEARALFLAEAARRLQAAADTLRVEDGEILAAGGARTSYAALARDVSLDRQASGEARPKPASALRVVGRDEPRIDLPDKVLGRARFVHDLRPPGMLHGRVLRPPSRGATLEALDEAPARAMPGVVAVVRDGRFVGIVAEREEQAAAALARLARDARWSEPATLPGDDRLDAWMATAPRETTVVVQREGAQPAAVAATRRARFTRPFTAHASIAPSCALAQWDAGSLHVVSHTQGIVNLRADLAILFGLDPEAVRVEHGEGAGCYGHNGADDAALDAALLARAVPGRPVRVLWSRADELAWSPMGPAMAVQVEADLDAHGEVVAWRGEIWSNGHGIRPGRSATPVLLAGTHLAQPFAPPVAVNAPLANGGGSERNADPGYGFPAVRVVNHRILDMPMRASALRALGAVANVLAIESLVDEVAAARGEDPLAWRLRHLADPRSRAVLESVARRAPWRGGERQEGAGRGLGFARYKGHGAYCAVAAEVRLTHEVRVTRLAIAIDVGRAVNPDGVANQAEGGAIQATSWALKEAVRFDATRVTSDAWESYPILRFSEVPAVDVEVLQRLEEPSMGAGEASMGPAVAAIANAIADAIGARVRDLPFTAERIAAAS